MGEMVIRLLAFDDAFSTNLHLYVNGVSKCFTRQDQLFMTLQNLKLSCFLNDAAERFCTRKATVYKIFITYILALHKVLFKWTKFLPPWTIYECPIPYKNSNRWRPNEAVVYISGLYTDCILDVAILEHINMLSSFSRGLLILADKGFIIYPPFATEVNHNITPF